VNTLEVDSVMLSFGGRRILSNVYLKCQSGEIVGLLGRNGSGKSSLLKIIFGSLHSDHQSVRIDGKYHDTLFRTTNTVHYMPQDGFSFPYMTFMDLISIFDLKPQLDQFLEFDEIKHHLNQKMGALSSGVRKFMEIITLLYTKGSFVLLDEPFSFLSPILVEKLIPHITKQSTQKGIILTDHQYETVLNVCNRFYLINNESVFEIRGIEDLGKNGYLIKQST
jgi:lipopolysaccharide export system ATP-binding protein